MPATLTTHDALNKIQTDVKRLITAFSKLHDQCQALYDALPHRDELAELEDAIDGTHDKLDVRLLKQIDHFMPVVLNACASTCRSIQVFDDRVSMLIVPPNVDKEDQP